MVNRNRNRLGQLELSNLISFFPERPEGEPNIIIKHEVDNNTLYAIGGIAIGTVLLTYSLNKFF